MPRHTAPSMLGQETAGPDDLTLLQRIIVRDEQAFAILYRRYVPMLQRFLSRMLAQPGVVDEVLNDVMLVLWQDAAQFPTTAPVGAWLHGIARHKAYKALRRQQQAEAPPPYAESTSETSPDPETLALRHEQDTRLAHELAAMSPTDRLLLEKLLYQGCSYQEMATQTGTPLNTVKARISRARRRLQERFTLAPAAAAA